MRQQAAGIYQTPGEWYDMNYPPVVVSASGPAQVLSFDTYGDTIYDVTLSEACAFTVTAVAPGTIETEHTLSVPSARRVILVLRPNGFQASFAASSSALAWQGGSPPIPSTTSITAITFLSTGTAPILGGI